MLMKCTGLTKFLTIEKHLNCRCEGLGQLRDKDRGKKKHLLLVWEGCKREQGAPKWRAGNGFSGLGLGAQRLGGCGVLGLEKAWCMCETRRFISGRRRRMRKLLLERFPVVFQGPVPSQEDLMVEVAKGQAGRTSQQRGCTSF